LLLFLLLPARSTLGVTAALRPPDLPSRSPVQAPASPAPRVPPWYSHAWLSLLVACPRPTHPQPATPPPPGHQVSEDAPSAEPYHTAGNTRPPTLIGTCAHLSGSVLVRNTPPRLGGWLSAPRPAMPSAIPPHTRCSVPPPRLVRRVRPSCRAVMRHAVMLKPTQTTPMTPLPSQTPLPSLHKATGSHTWRRHRRTIGSA